MLQNYSHHRACFAPPNKLLHIFFRNNFVLLSGAFKTRRPTPKTRAVIKCTYIEIIIGFRLSEAMQLNIEHINVHECYTCKHKRQARDEALSSL